jgi:hypothetical protein
MNGIGGNEYLKKARKLFEEMKLSWDIGQLDMILPDSYTFIT